MGINYELHLTQMKFYILSHQWSTSHTNHTYVLIKIETKTRMNTIAIICVCVCVRKTFCKIMKSGKKAEKCRSDDIKEICNIYIISLVWYNELNTVNVWIKHQVYTRESSSREMWCWIDAFSEKSSFMNMLSNKVWPLPLFNSR